MPEKIEMPKYKCHKEVQALEIEEIVLSEEQEACEDNECQLSPIIVFKNKNYNPLKISNEIYLKHKPKPGWYYVVYSDGYQSFSPKEAFEKGYSIIEH